MVNFWNQRRIANPSHLLLSGRGRSRPAGSIGLCGGSYCRRVSSVCDRQPTLDCQSSGRVPVIYTAAPRQLQTSLHCSRLLRIFAAGIEVWCNGSTTDFGSVCPGSNPGTSTEKVRPLDRTFLIHSNFLNVYASKRKPTATNNLLQRRTCSKSADEGTRIPTSVATESACRQYRAVRWPLLPEGELRPRQDAGGDPSRAASGSLLEIMK